MLAYEAVLKTRYSVCTDYAKIIDAIQTRLEVYGWYHKPTDMSCKSNNKTTTEERMVRLAEVQETSSRIASTPIWE